MSAVFDRIPHRLFNFANVYHFRKPQRTVVAWHALEAEPSILPLLILIVLVFAVLLLCRQVPLVLARRTKVWQWLKSLQFQQTHELPSQSSQTYDLHRKYSHAVEKLGKVVQKCQALQVQLKVSAPLQLFVLPPRTHNHALRSKTNASIVNI